MLAYGSDSPRSSEGPVAAACAPMNALSHHHPTFHFAPPPPPPPPQQLPAAAAAQYAPPPPPRGSVELVPLSLQAGNVVKLKGLPFKHTSEPDVARFFSAFRFASASPAASIFLRRHSDGRLTGEVSWRLWTDRALFFFWLLLCASLRPAGPTPEKTPRR
jgi:hypothetical protein